MFAMKLEKNTVVNYFQAQCVGEEKGRGMKLIARRNF